ncbi:MAG TPA: TetR/AcrR family transcriptional regulator [Acidimicrobiia bacterium]
MTAHPRARARKGEGERLRDEILDATQSLLVEMGSVDAVSIRAVADRVGVTPPSIYLHFADKHELFFECCRRGFEALEGRMRAAARGRGTAVHRLRRMGRAYVEFGLENGEQYRVLFGGGPPPSVELPDGEELPGSRAFAMLVETVAEGIASGVLRRDLDPVALAVAFWAAVHGTVMILLADLGDAIRLPNPASVVGAVLAVVEGGSTAS